MERGDYTFDTGSFTSWHTYSESEFEKEISRVWMPKSNSFNWKESRAYGAESNQSQEWLYIFLF